jgi:hypothetical protein
LCAQAETDAALNRNGSSTTEPTTTAHAHSTGQAALTETQFRAKVRLVTNLGKIRAVMQSTATRSEDSDESSMQPPGVAQGGETDGSSPVGPSTRPTAQQLYSQCTEQAQANGLDRSQVIALLEANGVHENERLIDGVFATCDAHATGRLKLAAFIEFYSGVSMRTRQRERREKLHQKRVKLVEERAAMHADGGYMMP